MKVFIYEMACAGGLGDDQSTSIAREGWAMLAALVEDFLHVDGLEIHTLVAQSSPRPLGHRCLRIPHRQEQAAFRDLVRHCAAALIIAPEWDGLLEARSREVLEAGKWLLGSAPEAIAVSADKQELGRLWQAQGVPTPAFLEADRLTFPLVCKPRHGAGSRGVLLVEGERDLAGRLEQARREAPGDEIILQEYVTGRPVSVAFLAGENEVVPLAAAAQHLSDDGRFLYLGGALPLPASLAARAVAVAKNAIAPLRGLRGYFGVDLVLGDGIDWAVELNPRPTTSYLGLRQLATTNLAAAWWRLLAGETIQPLAWRLGTIHFGLAEPGAKPAVSRS